MWKTNDNCQSGYFFPVADLPRLLGDLPLFGDGFTAFFAVFFTLPLRPAKEVFLGRALRLEGSADVPELAASRIFAVTASGRDERFPVNSCVTFAIIPAA
jgi:hypothetical protein